MAKDPRLLAAVKSALGTAVTLGYNKKSAAHDVYEAYILTLLIEAANQERWHWELRDQAGNRTSNALFRRGPGRLPCGNFTHVFLTTSGKHELEAHIGVQVRGVSKVAHEFDLLVLRSSDATACRTSNSDPSYRHVVAHAEAKHFGGDLPLPLGRAMLGICLDCKLHRKSVLVTNENGPSVDNLIGHYGLPFRFYVRPRGKGADHLIRLFVTFLRSAPNLPMFPFRSRP